METRGWCVRVVYAGGVERVRYFADDQEAVQAFRAMARDAKEQVDGGKAREATTSIAHRGRVLVSWCARARVAS